MGKATSDPSFNSIGQGPEVVPHHSSQVSFGGYCPIKSGESRWSYAKSVSRFHKSAEFLSDLIPHLLYFMAKFVQMITAPSSSRCGSWSKRSPGARPTRPTTASFGSEVSLEGNYKSSEFQPDWPRS